MIRFSLLISLVFSLSNSLLAKIDKGNQETNQYRQRVLDLLENLQDDPEYVNIQRSYEQRLADLRLQYPEERVNLTLDWSLSRSLSEDAWDRQAVASATFSLPDSGSQISAEHRIPEVGSALRSITELTYGQNLFRNRFGRSNQLRRHEVDAAMKSLSLQLKDDIESYLGRILQQITELIFLSKKIKVQEGILKENRKLFDFVTQRYNSGIALKSEQLRTKNSIIRSEQNIARLKTQERINKTLLRRRLADKASLKDLIPTMTTFFDQPTKRLKSIHRLQLERLQAEIDRISDDQEASLLGEIGIQNQQTESNSSQSAILGLSLDWDVYNPKLGREKQALQSRLEASKASQRLEMRERQDRILANRDEKRRLEADKDFNREKLDNTQRVFKEQRDRYERGLSSLDLLLDSQQSLAIQELEIIDNEEAISLLFLRQATLTDNLF
ncbi:MAG: TolC family protein [Pseudobacteriovorax sp.]|nr:TolC family protein [Pseudobacteriovorax sp.]